MVNIACAASTSMPRNLDAFPASPNWREALLAHDLITVQRTTLNVVLQAIWSRLEARIRVGDLLRQPLHHRLVLRDPRADEVAGGGVGRERGRARVGQCG